MADILDIVKGQHQQQKINSDKLRDLFSKKNVWGHFNINRKDFFNFSDERQRQLTSKFYFDNQNQSIDESITNIIKNSDGVNLTKIYQNDNNRTEMSILTEKKRDEKKPKSVTMWENNGSFLDECCNFNLEKANMPENTLFYVNQGYLTYKDVKKCYYNEIYIVAQIMSLPHQPKDIDSYDCKEDEVKILTTIYDIETGKFLGLEYCVALITVKNNPDEQFFDYGYAKSNSKVLYSTKKCKVPSSFKATAFGFLKNQFEGGALNEEDFSKIFFYLPSTVDRCEKINKYMTSVYLRTFNVDINDLGEDFNPALSFDRAAAVF